MLRLWRWYQNCLQVHPTKTQMISSAVIWGVGDVCAQKITRTIRTNTNPKFSDEDKQLKVDWKRVAAISLFGFGFVGPVGHFWYQGLDRVIRTRFRMQPNSFKFVATKVALDGAIFGPLDLLVFFSYMGLTNGKSLPQIKEDVKRDFIPAFVMEGGIWPILQVANFRYVPVPYQLLYVNFFCLLDSCFLSWIEQQEDAAWKKWLMSSLHLSKPEEQGR